MRTTPTTTRGPDECPVCGEDRCFGLHGGAA